MLISFAEHAQPLGAVIPVAPFMVMTTVQVPVVPEANCPAVAPPTVVPAEHPEIVNLVAWLMTPAVESVACPTPLVLHPTQAAVTDALPRLTVLLALQFEL